MKFKMIGIISLILLAVLTMSTAFSADNNMTDDIIGIENTQNDEISLEQPTNEHNIDDNTTPDIKSDKSKDILCKCNEDKELSITTDDSSIIGATITSTAILGATITEPTKITPSKTTPAKLTAAKKKTHYVKVGKYIGKLTNNQYKKLKNAYKKNKKYAYVTIKCINKKYHKITVEILSGYNPMNGKYYKKGFYGTVWDTRYGMDGTKISNKKVKLYTK